ncbi:metallopeptidase family protein [Novosphingobium aerophilum]|uniref:metallopeptidase family protein n=1 Tax=Novosphingobium TaxID=165696 RepID=UPI0006C8C972|nr:MULTISPECIES: metallopeptidase family protein [unclassified Novosphingobium]KPH57633.1 neutral zinc metallopeptidase [Novosphingobium sp. ST904]TCM43255.1 putative Zn-dependent protease with MMP-like domain [Novosphingobium sp. ST904]WRT93036.1 metallopeptidase family protein [Novosphingobium sp. RL4]
MTSGLSTRFGNAPGPDVFEALAHAAFARIPEPFAQHLDGVTVHVEEFADEDTLRAVGLEDAWELTGLYHGRPLDEESVWVAGEFRPRITLYRQPLLAEWCETGVTLEDLVTHVVVHEVGHHFGLSDDDMHGLEDDAD